MCIELIENLNFDFENGSVMIIFALVDPYSHFNCLICSNQLFALSLLGFLTVIQVSFWSSFFIVHFSFPIYKIYYLAKILVIFNCFCKFTHFVDYFQSLIYLDYWNMYFLESLISYFDCSPVFKKLQSHRLDSHFFIKYLLIVFDHQLL